MTYEAARDSITKFFATTWGNNTPVAYDDVVDDNIPPTNPQVTWARLNIKHIDGFQASTGSPGSNKFRRNGVITVQIFAAVNAAAKDAVAKAGQVVSLFQGKPRFEGVIFSNVRMNEIGPDGMGWYQVNVKIDFEYDDLA